jgi:metal-responsive CopG/Arc/MetJ family transcriptional regulator
VSVLEIRHMKQLERPYRLQVDVSEDDKVALDDFWFRERLPSRSAAIRELLRRALAVERQKEK